MSIEQDFADNLFQFMEETFESKHHGIYLDKGTSLFETLETVSLKKPPFQLEASVHRSRRRWPM